MNRFISAILCTAVVLIMDIQTGWSQCHSGGLKIAIKTIPSSMSSDTLPTCPSGGWCVQSIKATEGLKAEKGDYEITSFTIVMSGICGNGSGNIHEAVCNGNRYNFSVRNLINMACKGATIEFTCVKAKNKAGQIFQLESFLVTLE